MMEHEVVLKLFQKLHLKIYANQLRVEMRTFWFNDSTLTQ